MIINKVKLSVGKTVGILCRNAWKEMNVFAGKVTYCNDNPQQTLGGGLVCIVQPMGLNKKDVQVCFCKQDITELVEFWSLADRDEWLKAKKEEYHVIG